MVIICPITEVALLPLPSLLQYGQEDFLAELVAEACGKWKEASLASKSSKQGQLLSTTFSKTS